MDRTPPPDAAGVQRYLLRFGYLRPGAYVPGALDGDTVRALRDFQARHAVAVTGRLDGVTVAELGRPRCGLPDVDDRLAAVAGCRWPAPELTWAFGPASTDLAPPAARAAVDRAFRTWQAAVPVTLRPAGAGEPPDVSVEWRPAADPDHRMVGGVVAHADFPGACALITDTLPKPLHFDDSETRWVDGAVPGRVDVETVALHEIGHLLGLRHSPVRAAVMFPNVPVGRTARVLHPDDLTAAGALYPAALSPPARRG